MEHMINQVFDTTILDCKWVLDQWRVGSEGGETDAFNIFLALLHPPLTHFFYLTPSRPQACAPFPFVHVVTTSKMAA